MKKVNLGPRLIELNKVQKWTSLLLCILIFAVVAGLVLLVKINIWFLPVVFLLISGIQVHLSILLHEGAHYNLHPDKKVNEFISDLFAAAPLASLTKFYRALHLTHHRYTSCEELDPERSFFRSLGFTYQKMSKAQVFKMLAMDLCGYNVIRGAVWMNTFTKGLQQKKKLEQVNRMNGLAYLLFYGCWGVFFSYMDFLLGSLICWFLPLFTLSFCLIKLHSHGEHYFPTTDNEFERTFTREYNVITNFFIYPLNSGLHLEHHLYPTVPWYNQRKLKTALMQDPTYKIGAERATLSGYFLGKQSSLRELLK
ncbi:MAG TPA: fatty acid desaturase [Bacteriovoracaceae bacterium]|nr:fatty acid desaturase [Bacteriovoracaceae bacterium]